MFGRRLAIVGMSLALAAVTLNAAGVGNFEWPSYALNALMSIAIPVFIAWGILRLAERWLPAHLFVYLFVAAFFGAALNVILSGLASISLLGLASVHPLDRLLDEYLLAYALLAFAEAWLTGAVITVMVVYLPDWVGSFDDRRYLCSRRS